MLLDLGLDLDLDLDDDGRGIPYMDFPHIWSSYVECGMRNEDRKLKVRWVPGILKSLVRTST